MKNEIPVILEKNKPASEVKSQMQAVSGCCGGTPTSNEDACCKIDEEKKAEGESGCGCNTSADTGSKKSSCC